MKTREEIYGNEAIELLRNISMYRVLTEQQALRFYSGKEDKIKNLLMHLLRQGRIFYDSTHATYYAEQRMTADPGMTAAVWVLLDFIDKVEFHSISDFPAKLIFFAAGEVYEVLHVPLGQETLVSQLWSQQTEENPPRRIVVVDNKEQIHSIHIPSASGFCTVDGNGQVSYFKKE
ncbi:DUF5697 family protein [Anaerotignum sp.]|uniref:DUF5697 family protein n=1 Tax=Anaerotignum sp. TaxID=2039241 RepID=UPI0028AB2881|nr:DUF5697 family protein [Anaerotignum sp.]